uniref:Uncharacterized protein n=1 Tax=Amphimedon queenslandica TaxID=400682 RepID=A0A1X7VUH1_AMPQE
EIIIINFLVTLQVPFTLSPQFLSNPRQHKSYKYHRAPSKYKNCRHKLAETDNHFFLVNQGLYGFADFARIKDDITPSLLHGITNTSEHTAIEEHVFLCSRSCWNFAQCHVNSIVSY